MKGRSGKQCRERSVKFDSTSINIPFNSDASYSYKNQLDPAIRTGPWTVEEDKAIVCAQVTKYLLQIKKITE